MSKMNVTNLGSLNKQKGKKVEYNYTGGDQYTKVRCDICKFKYVKEEHPHGCPEGCAAKVKKASSKTE